MDRKEMIDLVEYLHSSDQTEDGYPRAIYFLKKSVPHVDIVSLIYYPNDDLTPEEIVDEALRLERERSLDPLPPYITHEMLLDNIGYLQQQMRDLGSPTLNVLIPLSLEYPHARLREMIWQTHVDATPEEIVNELYRREAASLIERGQDGQAGGPTPDRPGNGQS